LGTLRIEQAISECLDWLEATLDMAPSRFQHQELSPEAKESGSTVDPDEELDSDDEFNVGFDLEEMQELGRSLFFSEQEPEKDSAAPSHKCSSLDYDEDSLEYQEFDRLGAGQPIHMTKELDAEWKHRFPSNQDSMQQNKFAPFTSELDWRIAHWAVKDSASNNAFDRLLKIPEVYQALYQLKDSIFCRSKIV
jgi:hypothetical protein